LAEIGGVQRSSFKVSTPEPSPNFEPHATACAAIVFPNPEKLKSRHGFSSFGRVPSTDFWAAVSPATGKILERALGGADISTDEATHLFDAEGSELFAMAAAADYLRAQTVGDVVTLCYPIAISTSPMFVSKLAVFCAFSRGH